MGSCPMKNDLVDSIVESLKLLPNMNKA